MKEQIDTNKEENVTSDSEAIPMNSSLEEDLIKGPRPVSTVNRTSLWRNCCSVIFPCLKKVDTTTLRKVYLDNQALNITNWSNKEENNKFNVFTFFPITLFNQFRQFGNLFYLIMTITQFIPTLAVGFLFTYIAPLAFVVAVSMGKELYDDINRRIQDKKTNSTKITIIISTGNSVQRAEKNASDLQIGDVVELKKDGRVPADLVVLKTFNEAKDNQAFIRTDQLDGETDWKLRKAPGITQNMDESKLFSSSLEYEYEPPSKLIYEFKGVVKCKTEEADKKEPHN